MSDLYGNPLLQTGHLVGLSFLRSSRLKISRTRVIRCLRSERGGKTLTLAGLSVGVAGAEYL